MTDNQPNCIGLIGSGRLYQTMQSYLEHEYRVLPLNLEDLAGTSQEKREKRLQPPEGGTRLSASVEGPQQCSLILYCDDAWHFQMQQEINQRCLAMGIPWLRAYTEFGVGIIGPSVFPAEKGCLVCAETRRVATMNDANAENFITIRHTLGETKRALDQPWITTSSLEIIAQLVMEEVAACLQNPEQVKTRLALLRLELDTLHCQRHCFLPEPECSACGLLPPDTAESAMITLQSRPKLGPYTYRTRPLSAIAKQLFETYTDGQTGLIPILVKDTDTSIAMVNAQIGVTTGEKQRQMSGTGRTLSYEQSQLAAITEALERYGGQRPKGKRTVVQASYRQLGEQALDPVTLGLHTAEQYALPNYRYVPYHPDLICNWVWGYSFQQQCSILVPEHYAYYGLLYAREKSDSAFVYEISNGCALGNCLEEAIFHGILEVAERDAFLMTWYAQLSLPRLDLSSAADPTIGLLVENLEYETGYTIHVFNTILDHGVACCWVMAVDEQNRDGMPKALCSAGSHAHPEQAVISALLELDPMIKRQSHSFQKERERALEMLRDPFAVKEMPDHSCLYYLPEAFERLSFLYHSPQKQTFQEAFADFYQRPVCLDLREDLTHLIHHYLKLGIDIIVVEQTSAEHAAQDFHCVKVIMPGMLPMTFGHQHRRINGFKRLAQLPFELGYRSKPLADADINPHPHPFP